MHQLKVFKAVIRTPRLYTELKKAIDRRYCSVTKLSARDSRAHTEGAEELSERNKKVHSFFDYCCLLVLSGSNESMQFEDNIWEAFQDVEKIIEEDKGNPSQLNVSKRPKLTIANF